MKKRTPFLMMATFVMGLAGMAGQAGPQVLGCHYDTVWLEPMAVLHDSVAFARAAAPFRADVVRPGHEPQGGLAAYPPEGGYVRLRVRLENRFFQEEGRTDWLLESDAPGVRQVEVIREHDGVVLQRWWAPRGKSLPRTGWRSESGLPGDVRLRLPVGEPVAVHLEAEGWQGRNRLWLRPAPRFRQWGNIWIVWTNWLSIGLTLTFLLYNLIFFMGSRGRIFLYHALFQTGVLLYLLSAYGIMDDLGGRVAYPVLLAVLVYAGFALADAGFILFLQQIVPGIGKSAGRMVQVRTGVFLVTVLLVAAGQGMAADHLVAVFAVFYYGYLVIRTWRSPLPFHIQGWWRAVVLFIFAGVVLSGVAVLTGSTLPIRVVEVGILVELFFFSAALVLFIKHVLSLRGAGEKVRNDDKLGAMLLNEASMELKKPLTLLSGLVHGYRGQPADGSMPAPQRNAAGALVRQLTSQVNHMERLARMSGSYFEPSPRREELILFLRQLTASLGSHTLQREVLLSLQSTEAEIWMDFDPEALREVMTYLLSEAILSAPPGERITVEVALRGEGIDREVAIRLQGLPADTRVAALRTLLGLPVKGAGDGRRWSKKWVSGMVRRLGGRLRFRPENEPGTVFLLTLPWKETTSRTYESLAETDAGLLSTEPATPVYGGEPGRSVPRLLIVENDRAVAGYLEQLLRDEFRIHTLFSAQDALAYAHAQVPDLILTEVVLPDDNGLSLCRRLKQDPSTSHIPILVATVLGTPRDKIESLGCGADVFLAKPFHPMELQLYLSNLLRNRLRQQALLQGEMQPSGEGKRLVADLSYKREHAFLDRIRKVVEENMEDEGFGIPQLCQRLNMSRSQLHRKLKALTGTSTSQLINEIRMATARQLLLETDLNVTEVAYRVGVAPNYFSRAFKAFAGIAPKDFRRQPNEQLDTDKSLEKRHS